jgi:1,4-dihydroxy-2-naphthoate polyprenyltransferase
MAARPRTLPAAIAPVLVGSAAADWEIHTHACHFAATLFTSRAATLCPQPSFRWLAFVAALVGSIFIQIGTNLANDYSDARRGADSADRLGPVRVTSSGMVAPRRVLVATWLAFAVAVAAGVYLATVAGVVILAVGAASIVAGVLYTGGPRPYGYEGLGEIFVFLFFGLVAVNGSYYVQVEHLDWVPFGLSLAVGSLATAILAVNNVRDIDTDRRAGKRTLAVRIGRDDARGVYVGLIVAAFLALLLTLALNGGPWWAALGFAAAPLAIRPARAVVGRTDGPALNAALAGTGALLGAFSVATAAGLLIAA